jgi:cytoskeleton protein RodZ
MNQDIGRKFKQARQDRSLTLEQVSEATYIRLRYLQAIEDGELNILPSVAQERGFIRAYASYLSIDINNLLLEDNQLSEEIDLSEKKIPESIEKDFPPPQNENKPESLENYFLTIGKHLSKQREILGLTLEDIERHTHLKKHYIQALEAGDLGGLPSPVQGRGMLKNYASFLGLDPEPLLLRFADGLQAKLANSRPKEITQHKNEDKQKIRLPLPLRRMLSADIWIGILLTIGIIGFFAWGGIRILAMDSEQQPTLTAPSIADVLLASPTVTASLTPEPGTPTQFEPIEFPTLAIATDAESGKLVTQNPEETLIEVYLNVRQRTWIRVTTDGEITQEGRVIPGSSYAYNAKNSIELTTGNAAAIQVYFNGVDLGTLGDYGQVVNRIYSYQGIITATPTISPTPTVTQPSTPTPTPPAIITQQPGEATVTTIP